MTKWCYSSSQIEDSMSWKPYYPLEGMVWTYNENSETKYIALTKAKNDNANSFILFGLSSGSKKFLTEKTIIFI